MIKIIIIIIIVYTPFWFVFRNYKICRVLSKLLDAIGCFRELVKPSVDPGVGLVVEVDLLHGSEPREHLLNLIQLLGFR